MENNQNEKVSITFEVEKEFIKAVMLVSGISMKDAEEAMNELDNVVINEDTLQDLETTLDLHPRITDKIERINL